MKKQILCFCLMLGVFMLFSGCARQILYSEDEPAVYADVSVNAAVSYEDAAPDETEAAIAEALAHLANLELSRPVSENFLRWANENIAPDFTEALAAGLAEERDWREPFFDLFGKTLHVLWGHYTGALQNDPNIHATGAVPGATLAFGGDVNLADTWENMLIYHQAPGGIEEFICEDLLGLMRGADILMVNNEFTFSDRGSPLPGKMYTFRATPRNVYMLHDMGVDIVSTANNHIYDYGTYAFLDTLDTLTEAGIPQVGAGRNIAEAMQAQYFHAGGMKIAFLAANDIERAWVPEAAEDRPGTLRPFGEADRANEHLLEAIATARQNADWVVVYLHWGVQYVTTPQHRQVNLARELIDAGVDFVIGAHPHVLQGIEFYNDRPIVYSLGDFWFNMGWVRTMLLEIELFAPGEYRLRVHPATTAGGRSLLFQDERYRNALFRHLESLSWGIAIEDDGLVTRN